MAYKIVKQFQPNSNVLWVEKLTPEDTVDIFDTEAEALAKVSQLQSTDTLGRKFEIKQV